MKRLNIGWLIALVAITSCLQKIVKQGTIQPGVIINATSSINPIMKGLSANPVLHVRVYVPAEGGTKVFTNLHCSLNPLAINDIEKIQVFFTNSEPLFDTKNLVASVMPSTGSIDIPVNFSLQPGVHYIWLSATLKPTANMDHTVELRALALTNNNGIKETVIEDNTSFVKHIGIAIRKAGDDGVHTYRIPGITTTSKGTLVAVYDIRYKHSGDLPANIDVGMSRSTDGGTTWSRMKIIMDMGEPHDNNGVGDPSILFDPVTNKLWVAALWSKGNRSIAGSKPGLSPDETGQFVVVSSDDDGLTWSQPYSITPQVKNPEWKIFFPGPGNGIAMQDGKIVFPAQYWDASNMPYSTLVYSADHGLSWKRGIGAKSNTTESTIVETMPGSLMLNMRDNRGGFRSIATTSNLGASWTEHFTSYRALPDPVCMGNLVKANVSLNNQSKDLLFFSNAATTTGRYNFTIKASDDLGATWRPSNELLVDERKSFGYSAITRVDANTIGALYEGTRDLYFVRIPVSEIIKKID